LAHLPPEQESVVRRTVHVHEHEHVNVDVFVLVDVNGFLRESTRNQDVTESAVGRT
jgi:hypothetical protein